MALENQYSNIKDSGIKWIGEILENWEVGPLKRFCQNITDGSHYSPESVDKGKYYITVSDLKKDYIDFNNAKKISEEDFERLKINGCQPKLNDVILSKDGTIGKCIVVENNNFVALSSLGIITPNENLDPYFLRYYLISDDNISQMFSFIRGSALKRLTITIINNLILIFPPIKEQQSIVSFLDKKTSEIDKTIEKDTKLIELLKEKRTALINHVVTKGLDPEAPMKDSGIEWIGEIPEIWDVRRIKSISLVKRGASPRPIDDPKYFDTEGEYSWVRIADVTASDKYLNKSSEKLSQLGKSLSVALEPGELFISIAATVGKPIITNIKCCIHDGFIYFQNLDVYEEYLYYIFIGGQAFQGLGKLGTQLNLNTETIGGITIPFPSNTEQQDIVDYLDKKTSNIDQTINKIQSKIDLLQKYKKSLIHHTVTGKIDVREVEA